MELDAVVLARIQFAFTIAFHIIFPTFTIGLSAWIATLLVIWRRTGVDRYRDLARFWTRIFAVSFAMGVVSGIVLSYQFGTNWSGFSEVVGNVVAPLIGYEVLTAFFLEATFLGIMLFGWNRVPPWLHVLSAVLVALGTLFSAFWILSANSWMQHPAGHVIRDGIAYPADWLAIVFNPTFPLRFIHMVLAAYLTTAFVVLATGARYLLADVHRQHGLTMLRMGLGMAVVLAPLQLVIGDMQGLMAARVQPAKIAAVEGHWDSSGPAPLVLFAIPDEKAETNRLEISIPKGASLLITHSLDGRFPGLKDFVPEDRPPVFGPFFGFRIMVGIGLLMILMAAWGTLLWWRKKLEGAHLFLRLAALTWPGGFIAVLAGWVVAEQGRQPWIATGILRTADAASPVSAMQVAVTLALFVIVYAVIFSAGIVYINRLPAAIAAKLRHPERPVVAFAGDGCFQLTSQEFATAVQEGAAIVLVVVNNGIHGTIRMHQERDYPGRVIATDLRNPDFAALARAHGGHGETVSRTEDFAGAFDAAMASGKPAIIDLKFDPEASTTSATLSQIRARHPR